MALMNSNIKNNMKSTILALISTLALSLSAQDISLGTIHYDRTTDYSRIIDELPYLSAEQKDLQKLTRGNRELRASPYILSYSPDQTIYTYGKEERESNWSWRKDEFLIIHDMAAGTLSKQYVLGGKLYLLEDEAPRLKWKIENDIREIAGYLCMKATTYDPVKGQDITAWFSDQIPVSAGPEGYYGLPGMILMIEVNNGTAVIEATKVDLDAEPYELPKKIKGKKRNQEEYVAQIEKFLKDCIEGERNPYWDLRY